MRAREWGLLWRIVPTVAVALQVSFHTSAATTSLTVEIPSGFSTTANPLETASYAVSNLFPNVPVGTMLYKFDTGAQKWSVNQWQFGAWNLPEQTLGPGEGAMIRNPSNPFFVTFNGTLPTNFVPALKPGFNLVSLPQGGVGNLNPGDDDRVGVWDPVLKGFSVFIYHSGSGWTSGTAGQSNPPIHPGESFIYFPDPQAHPSPPDPLPSYYFNNRVPAAGISAPFLHSLGCANGYMLVQLFSGPAGGFDPLLVNVPEGAPVPITTLNGYQGWIDPYRDLVRFSTNVMGPLGSRVFELRVWDSRAGPAYDDIWGSGYDGGRSGLFHLYSPEPWWGNWGPFGAFVPPRNLDTLFPFEFGKLNPFPPGVRWQPTNAAVFEGESAAFENDPLFTYPNQIPQWQKQTGSNVWSDIGLRGEWSLILESVQKSDAGNYRLYLHEDCGGFASMSGQLIVLDRPRFGSTGVREPDGAVLLQVQLEPNRNYMLDVSSNLTNWTSLASILNAPASWEWTATNAPDSPGQFYRIRVLE